jgi:hypothetical protein
VTGLSRRALRGALLLLSLVLATALAEAALRFLYRDAGRSTLGGPGGQPFDHETIDGELRGRRDVGPRKPGVPRLMIVGDSISYGLGVRDWRQTWPELLASELERHGRPHEVAVFAFPGQDITQHVNVMREWDTRVAPDVFIYQWYVNDIEAISHRPDLARAWQRWPLHETLRDRSYLYFVLDHRLAQFLRPPTRSYVDYLLTDFTPGTMEWAEFERQFHEFATRAQRVAPRRIMALYPQVPFRGRYPLQDLNDRMRTVAGAHDLEIPPSSWVRAGGSLVADPAAPRRQVFAVPAGATDAAIETPEYMFAAGPLTVVLVARRAAEATRPHEPLGTLQPIDAATGHVLQEITFGVDGLFDRLTQVRSTFVLAGEGLQRIRFRVRSTGGAGWALANVQVPVNYGFEVVDFTEPLNGLSTHASAFDAHPNVAAHRLMAQQLYAALTAPNER